MALDVKTIGIIGAGQMGSGIAQICAQSGYTVKLSDIDAAALAKALAGVKRKAASLHNADWERSFLAQPLHADILAAG